MKILYNPLQFYQPDLKKNVDTVDISDYPIAEALKNSAGEPVWDDMMGTYRTTGQTIEVTIKRGTASEFEDYLADILLDRFGFLQEKTAIPKSAEKVDNAIKAAGAYKCPTCSKTFEASDELGLHIGIKHPETLSE